MVLCKKCDAKCCRYFALHIDTPRKKHDFENIRWYLAHKGVTIFVEKRKWYLEIANECRYLKGDHKCGIYDKRPLICREHSTKTCEHVFDKFEHDYIFNSLEKFDKYLDKRLHRRNKK